VILDWDDTLFPTTWVREDVALDWQCSVDMQLPPSDRSHMIKGLLSKHELTTARFLDGAVKQAKVFIVTLARRPWVVTSCKNFFPELHRLIERHKLDVIYAQECASEVASACAEDDFQSVDQACDYWTKVKELAISKELDNYHKRIRSSWKNIISLGDSDFERFGTISAGEDYMKKELDGGQLLATGATAEGISKDGSRLKLRTKTLKMLSEPTVEEMTAELTLLSLWLPYMVAMDEGFDREIECTDDDIQLNAMHEDFTGQKDANMSWSELAGMEEDADK